MSNFARRLLITVAAATPFAAGYGYLVYHLLTKHHVKYTPGQSLTKKSREAVDALNDSTLITRTISWEKALADYELQYKRAADLANNERESVLNKKRNVPTVVLPDTLNTLQEYKERLQKYGLDSIETRYQLLANQLANQK